MRRIFFLVHMAYNKFLLYRLFMDTIMTGTYQINPFLFSSTITRSQTEMDYRYISHISMQPQTFYSNK